MFASLLLVGCGQDGRPRAEGFDPGISAAEDDDADETGDSPADGDTSSTNAGAPDVDEDPFRFDLAALPDAAFPPCSRQRDDELLSYIWVANSGEGTISKINTQTMIEEGRYRTRPDDVGSPSRTSVNLQGDVAVANRNGGITKVIADPERCDKLQNGRRGLQTSTGKHDVLAWGRDDCVAWYTPLRFTANRPVAWSFGALDPVTCESHDAKLWTAASNGSGSNAHAFRLDGETGRIEVELPLPTLNHNNFGPYGGAVDPDQNFWVISHGNRADLARIDAETLVVTVWDIPQPMMAYGFTIDEYGRPWIGGAGGSDITMVFDPETERFATLPKAGLGMGQARDGLMWQAMFSDQNGVRAWDIDTLQIVTEIDIPVVASRGVSVDADGFVWFIEVGRRAFKINPNSRTYQVYDGLVGAYTYSDMTGNALSIVAGSIAG
jgi:DNA-binding beta-propeller fold protein YncE